MSPVFPPLVSQLQKIIERTYALPGSVPDAGRFILGDEGYRRIVARGAGPVRVVGSGSGACLLLRPPGAGGPWRAAIYYPDALIERLETDPPSSGLHDGNIDDFAVLVEELDHFLCVAERLRLGRSFSLLELELQANVTKFLAAAHWLRRSRGGRSGDVERRWLLWQLFDKGDYADPDPRVAARYRDARRFAVRFLRRIEPLRAVERLGALRRFHRQSHAQKLALLS